MDFNEGIRHFADNIDKIVGSISTEEATKMSLIVPVFQQLGYDVFNPTEFCPEYIADVGIKKGEKVDYAILRNGEPIILIECKSCTEDLDKHGSQLYRYFGASTAKFGILTNGIIYRFFTDLEKSNTMDMVPFLEIDMRNLDDNQLSQLRKFHKENFDTDKVFSAAEELKYTKLVKDFIRKEFEEPSDEFLKLILTEIHKGVKTQKVIDKYRPLVKRALSSVINEIVNKKLTNALDTTAAETTEPDESAETEEPVSKIITTEEEMESFYIVRAILAETVSADRVARRDTESYFGILFDDNNRKPICRVNLDGNKKWLMLPDENKSFSRQEIKKPTDIYKYKKDLIDVVKRYL